MDYNPIHICDPIPVEELQPLLELLSKITIPKSSSGNRKGFGASRYACFGVIRARKSGIVGQSAATRKYPKIWAEIQRIGNLLKGRRRELFKYTSVHLNQDVECPPHKDRGNIGDSILFGFGDYVGGELCTEFGHVLDINCKPVCFNGSQVEHWNTPITKAGKYSLVFYVHREALKKAAKETFIMQDVAGNLLPFEGNQMVNQYTDTTQSHSSAENPETPLGVL